METTKRITAYYAGPVRGKSGDNATKGEMRDNLIAGRELCERLRRVSGWTVFCPHDAANEDVVSAAYHLTDDDGNPRVAGQQIVDHCKQILVLADVFVLGCEPDRDISDGVWQEHEHALDNEIPVFNLYRFADKTDTEWKSAFGWFELKHNLRHQSWQVSPTMPGLPV